MDFGGALITAEGLVNGPEREEVGTLRRVGCVMDQRRSTLEVLGSLGIIPAPQEHGGLAGGGQEVVRLAFQDEVELLDDLVVVVELFVGLGQKVAAVTNEDRTGALPSSTSVIAWMLVPKNMRQNARWT